MQMGADGCIVRATSMGAVCASLLPPGRGLGSNTSAPKRSGVTAAGGDIATVFGIAATYAYPPHIEQLKNPPN
jgi:hypothetical protein